MVKVLDAPDAAMQAGSDAGPLDGDPTRAGAAETPGERAMSNQAQPGRSLLSPAPEAFQRRSLFGR